MDNKIPLTAQPARRLLLSLLIALLPLLYACTEEGTETYTVTFNTNGGSAVKSQEVEKDKKAAKPAEPTKEEYDFGGWYTDEALTKSFNFSATAITQNTKLYAKWTRVFTVRFQANGGTEITDQMVESGHKPYDLKTLQRQVVSSKIGTAMRTSAPCLTLPTP